MTERDRRITTNISKEEVQAYLKRNDALSERKVIKDTQTNASWKKSVPTETDAQLLTQASNLTLNQENRPKRARSGAICDADLCDDDIKKFSQCDNLKVN